MLDPTLTKADLRAAVLARRAALSDEARREGSTAAAARLVPLLRQGETVSLFWPMRGEIDPLGLVDPILALEGRVVMPVVDKRRMFFRAFAGAHGLEEGAFGTKHPHAGHPVLDPDLIIAPLAAFDRRGGRLGYGAGYYDRAIAELKARGRPFRIAGIAFACQEAEAVPVEAHDEPLSLIATERELIRVGQAA